MVYIFMKLALKDFNNGRIIFSIGTFDFKPFYLLCFIVLVICYLAVTIAASLLSINRVKVDTNTNTLTFIGLFSTKTIVSSDIKEYFETTHRNSFKSFHGLLLKLNDNRRIQIAGQNVGALSDLKDYLNNKRIICGGQTRMKFPFN
jgi:hypothetical protein